MDGKSLVPSGHLRTRMRCPCHAYLFLSPCHAPIQSTLRSRIAHLQDSIPSHPILSTHHVPSHPITHRPSPIPYPDCPASWSTVHSPQSTVHNSRTAPSTEKKEGSNKKKSQDPGGYIKKEPLCPTCCIFPLEIVRSAITVVLLLYSCALPSLSLEIDEIPGLNKPAARSTSAQLLSH
ncbi:uncharacterized protein CLUP02_06675 [Colletotrichum lupini]|uniref:Uncharacterized protein n=1 Tax=Colletotrichum lupini TaxID=145971 RepID=A0A9Q8WF97_9PEZI|nr:uncharacterized protein CLUP02_06675 [Colletotrichum lupini]UQC81189.1 hypothetical protein CLUP02_06675 [Colletotrichum lupini]